MLVSGTICSQERRRHGTYADGLVVVELQLRDVRRVDAVVLQLFDVHMEALDILLVFFAAGHRCRHVAGEISRK